MREIKFRGLKDSTNEWIYGSLVLNEVSNSLIIPIGKYISSPEMAHKGVWVKTYTVGQYTGLKDKNGKEIYEGDIVSYFGLKYEVLFKNGAFGWMEDGEFYSFNEMARSEFNKFEIIGNVYEDLELLEESK